MFIRNLMYSTFSPPRVSHLISPFVVKDRAVIPITPNQKPEDGLAGFL